MTAPVAASLLALLLLLPLGSCGTGEKGARRKSERGERERGGGKPGVQCLCQAVVAVGGGAELEIGRIGMVHFKRGNLEALCRDSEIFQV